MIDPFLIKLILSFFVGGLYIAFTIFISEKFGSKIGGIILGLPSTTLISLIFIAWTQDVSAVQTALPIIPAALSVSALFVVVFILFHKYGLKIAFLTAILVWGCLDSLLILLNFDLVASILLAAVIFTASILVLRKFPHKMLDKPSISHKEFLMRSCFAGSVVAIAVLLGKYLGPEWGGIFGVFPAAFTSTLYLLSTKYGFEFTSSIARTMPYGMIASAVFAVALFLAIPSMGFIISLVVSYLLSVLCAVLIYWAFICEKRPEAAAYPKGKR